MTDERKLIDADDVEKLGLLREWTERSDEFDDPDDPPSPWVSVNINPGEKLDIIFKPNNEPVRIIEIGSSRKDALLELYSALQMYWTYIYDLSEAIKSIADGMPEDDKPEEPS